MDANSVIKIEQDARAFRSKIERARNSGAFGPKHLFRSFPKGCCEDASILLANYFKQLHEGHDYTIYCGEYEDCPDGFPQRHVWLAIDESLIVDITADQFQPYAWSGHYAVPVYVGPGDALHTLFSEVPWSEAFDSFEQYGAMAANNLHDTYRIIMTTK